VGVIIAGIIVDLGGSPSHDRIGFRLWKNPGPFAVDYNGITGPKGHFLGTCSTVTQIAFSFVGTEAVAVRSFVTTHFCPA
jgi:amino acid transporter